MKRTQQQCNTAILILIVLCIVMYIAGWSVCALG
jgi:hypothetical protein